MKKSVVSRELAPPCNLRSEFMITLPDREMLYVTGVFNGQYLMAETSRSSGRVSPLRSIARRRWRARKGKTVASSPLFAAVNLPGFSNFDRFALVSMLLAARASPLARPRDPARRAENTVVPRGWRARVAPITYKNGEEMTERKSAAAKAREEAGGEQERVIECGVGKTWWEGTTREKNSIHPCLVSADFPRGSRRRPPGRGTALNRFGRVIAIPPLRFHATFAATSADLPPLLVVPRSRLVAHPRPSASHETS